MLVEKLGTVKGSSNGMAPGWEKKKREMLFHNIMTSVSKTEGLTKDSQESCACLYEKRVLHSSLLPQNFRLCIAGDLPPAQQPGSGGGSPSQCIYSRLPFYLCAVPLEYCGFSVVVTSTKFLASQLHWWGVFTAGPGTMCDAPCPVGSEGGILLPDEISWQ